MPGHLGDGPGLVTTVYGYHAGLMDSALAVLSGDATIFNANDARISTAQPVLVGGLSGL
jgi:hypothetical protein